MSSTMLAIFDFWFLADLEVHFSLAADPVDSGSANRCVSDMCHDMCVPGLALRRCKKWSLKSSTYQRMLRQKRKKRTGHKTRCFSGCPDRNWMKLAVKWSCLICLWSQHLEQDPISLSALCSEMNRYSSFLCSPRECWFTALGPVAD